MTTLTKAQRNEKVKSIITSMTGISGLYAQMNRDGSIYVSSESKEEYLLFKAKLTAGGFTIKRDLEGPDMDGDYSCKFWTPKN